MAKRWSYYRIYEVYSLEVFSFTVKNPIILCLGALRELGIGSLLPPLLLSRFSCVRLCATPQMAAHQAPLSKGFSRQEYRRGLPFPSPMHAVMLSHFSRIRLCATPWIAAHQAPLSNGFSRQEYWSGLPLPSPFTTLTCGVSPFSAVPSGPEAVISFQRAFWLNSHL